MPFCEISLKIAKLKPYPTNPQTIGDHLKKRRHELGLWQKDVSERLGVNVFTVCGWENNKKMPAVRYLPPIIKFLRYYPFRAPQTLAERLLAHRRRLGLCRKAVAQRLSVDEGTLERWELEKAMPTGERLWRVEKFLASNKPPEPVVPE